MAKVPQVGMKTRHYAVTEFMRLNGSITGLAERFGVSETTLMSWVEMVFERGQRVGPLVERTPPPGVLSINSCVCGEAIITVYGSATPDNGETLVGLHAVVVPQNDPEPARPNGPPPHMDFPFDVDDIGQPATVYVWAVFEKTTQSYSAVADCDFDC